MRVGHAHAAIPVPAGTPLGGYAQDGRVAEGALDDLELHALALATPTGCLVLVVADIVCVNADLARRAREHIASALAAQGGPPVEVWLAATHTHSGPDLGSRPGGGPTPAPWLDRLADLATATALRAIGAAHDVDVMHHAGEVRGIGSARAVADGPAVVPADALAFTGPDGALTGVLAVLPVHPTVLPAASRLVSGDLTSGVRRGLERRLATAAARPWVVVATGAAGDISTRRTRRDGTAAECERLAAEAVTGLAALLAAPGTPVGDDPHLAWSREAVELAARHDDAGDLATLRAGFEARLASAEAHGDAVAARTATTALQGVTIAASRSRVARREAFTAELATARIGALTLHAIGGEPFLATGRRLAAASDDPCVLLGYANGYIGYLPVAGAGGEPTYEELASPLAAGAAHVVEARLQHQSRTLVQETRP